MKKIFTIFILIGLTTKSFSNTLTIYTYDSFESEWGPGPIIEKVFEEKYKTNIDFIAVDSAATLLTKIKLEGSSTKADIILGLDMNILEDANNSNLFVKHKVKDLKNKIKLPIMWNNENFIPYNYGYFAFVYNNTKITNPPNSMDELINNSDLKIVIQDPRTSTPGLGLLTWMKAIYGNNASNEWKKLNKKIVSVTKGWTDSYYNIFMQGEADLVLSYTTSPAAHVMFENNYDISSINFTEGNYITVEFAGILKTSKNKELSNQFLNFILTEDFQSIIPSTNIMYPVTEIKNLPDAFKLLKKPNALQINPSIISLEKEKWIEEWLNTY